MTEAVTPSIDALVSAFESGKPVFDLLDELNKNTEGALLAHIGYEEIDELNCTNVSHQDDIFITDDDITKYYEKNYLLGLNNQQILSFVKERQVDLYERDEGAVIHYLPISKSCIGFLSECGGQAGPILSQLHIGHEKQDIDAKFFEDGLVMDTDELSTSEKAVLKENFHKLVRMRLLGKVAIFPHFKKMLRRK